ncbi:acyltransferase family protein [Halobacteriovorax sp. ZH5_bin.2]|uniref:acyltransferase family protein n=1 Tax=Halobacteriovorax sp. ZH5_bin.2 TaxID=3157727 RepID=UPI0037210E4E
MTFRKDINALRAIAVIGVVLFHFFPNLVPGGFAGVDVFFVISGYLMTEIIFKKLEEDNFSFVEFYFARFSRIVPALLTLCFFLLIISWFFLVPLDYRTLSKHVISSITFISNIIYYKESGYFDSASLEKWLLHTWSLSVEWQFYLIYPIFILTTHKVFSKDSLKRVFLVTILLGILFSTYLTYTSPSKAYYYISSRFWQMQIGSILYLYKFEFSNRRKHFLFCLGILGIVLSYFIFDERSRWPGIYSLLPISGSLLFLYANIQNNKFLNSYLIQKIGTYSYSIYLWHWPFVVALYYFNNDSLIISIVALLCSIIFSLISFHMIESKFRTKKSNSILRNLKSKPIYIFISILAFSSVIYKKNGFENRFEKLEFFDQLVMPLKEHGYCFNSAFDNNFKLDKKYGTSCYLGSKIKDSNIMLFGDSFAAHMEPFFDKLLKKQGLSILSVTTNWCTASFNDDFNGKKSNVSFDQCLLNREFLKDNYKKFKSIIFAGSWGDSLKEDNLENTLKVIKQIAKSDVNVFIIQTPYRYQKSPLVDFYRSYYFSRFFKFDVSRIGANDYLNNKANSILSSFAKKYKNVYMVKREDMFNESNTFEFKGYILPYTFDGKHLSLLGSLKASDTFENSGFYEQFLNLLKKRKSD